MKRMLVTFCYYKRSNFTDKLQAAFKVYDLISACSSHCLAGGTFTSTFHQNIHHPSCHCLILFQCMFLLEELNNPQSFSFDRFAYPMVELSCGCTLAFRILKRKQIIKLDFFH